MNAATESAVPTCEWCSTVLWIYLA